MRPSDARAGWKPVGVRELEPKADEATRCIDQNVLVIAGPGAGKTELLAQRAAFLLQTQTCSDPRRILAISFKRDAARNLRERVIERCGRDLGWRFDSFTFDGFSKGLVDRFRAALPSHLSLAADYTVLTDFYGERQLKQYLLSMPGLHSRIGRAEREVLGTVRFYRQQFLGQLPAGNWDGTEQDAIAVAELWNYLLSGKGVSFPMLGRLAEVLIRSSDYIAKALRDTYQFVFLDEFQDTTNVHYDLVRTAFRGTSAAITAVGDNKQRIMGWAGALEGIFEEYAQDFAARTVRLERNHRSTQLLVDVQTVIAKALDAEAAPAQSFVPDSDQPSECCVLLFKSEEEEAGHLAALLYQFITHDAIPAREICILVRQKAELYTDRLRRSLEAVGVPARVETTLQDLLSEPLCETVLDCLRLATKEKAPEAWMRTISMLQDLHGLRDGSELRQRIDALANFILELRLTVESASASEGDVRTIVGRIMTFVDENSFRATFPQYLQGSWYESTLTDLIAVIVQQLEVGDWASVVDKVEGRDCVPIITMHKSKGLEYHTVIFVGLEDGAFWGYRNNVHGEGCGFFVALSRAKRRAIFTFSGIRPSGRNGTLQIERRNSIADFYDLLEAAGIRPESFGTA